MVEKGLGYERESTMQRSHAGGKGAGVSATRTRRRKERERKAEEETHAMDKPKTIEEVSDGDLSEIKKDPIWKSWLEMIIKPIPDSKGGKGSFQHCINANQDKHNPGGWCKQIERKIGKAKKVPNKEVKLPQTKINEPKHWWDHSKVGRNTSWEDDPMNKPTYFQAIMEEERKKREKKKAEPERPCPACGGKNVKDYDQTLSGLYGDSPEAEEYECNECGEHYSRATGKLRRKRESHKADKIEEPETDYYMDAGGNPQLKEKTDYFVEEIRANIIYYNKIFPILGVLARGASMVGRAGLKIGDEILSDMKEVGQGAMQGIGDEAEEEEEQ